MLSLDPLSLLGHLLTMGAIQGIILSGLLFFRRENRMANRFLAFWIILFSLELVLRVLLNSDFYYLHPEWLGTTISFDLLYGPLFYFYVRALMRKQPFRWFDLTHSILFLRDLYFVWINFYQPVAEKLAFHTAFMRGELSLEPNLFGILRIMHPVLYIVASLLLLKQYNQQIRSQLSNLEQSNLRWLKVMSWCQVGIWALIFVIPYIGYYFIPTLKSPLLATITYIPATIWIFSIGYLGLAQSQVFQINQFDEPGEPTASEETATEEEEVKASEEPPEAAAPTASPLSVAMVTMENKDVIYLEESREEPVKYQRNRLPDEAGLQLKNQLLAYMKSESPHLDGQLTLTQLADELGVTSYHLSQVINDRLQQNFYDFINGYRVNEVKKMLTNPALKNEKLITIALNAGFNSKSTFNSIFKKYTDMTPTEFRRNHKLREQSAKVNIAS